MLTKEDLDMGLSWPRGDWRRYLASSEEQKAGTAEGARKAWLLRRQRQLSDALRQAQYTRDAVKISRLQRQIIALQRLAGAVAQAKHLAGKHDQKEHGKKRLEGKVKPPVSSSDTGVAKFGDEEFQEGNGRWFHFTEPENVISILTGGFRTSDTEMGPGVFFTSSEIGLGTGMAGGRAKIPVMLEAGRILKVSTINEWYRQQWKDFATGRRADEPLVLSQELDRKGVQAVEISEGYGVPVLFVRDISILKKHLPGQHDQTTHAGERGAGEGVAGEQAVGQAPEQSEFARTIKGTTDPAGAWKALAPEEKDRLADAANSIASRWARESAEFGEADLTGSLDDIVDKRLAQVGDRVMPDARTLIAGHMKQFGQALAEAGVPEAQAKALLLRSTDALAIQERESMGRQLGDHGARHLLGDAAMALEILRGHPDADSPQQTAAIYIASVFHDAGYTTEPGGVTGMDGRHPTWSKQYYDAQVKPAIAEALGNDWAEGISHMIETHADGNLDWDNDPVTSALRVADNLALFHSEKLPALFKYVPQNIPVLMQLGEKKIDLATARAQMAKNIGGVKLPGEVQKRLLAAVEDVGVLTPKFTLGMLGGSIKRLQWQGNYLNVFVNRNRAAVRLQQHLDLGQRQFLKFAEAYLGEGAKEQLGAGGFVFGKPPQLKFTIGGEVIKALVAELRLRTMLAKHLPGKHDQLTHGRKAGAGAGKRVWTGEQQEGPTARGKTARLELGERGERLAERVLEELSGSAFDNLNSAVGEHSPLDLVGDSRAVEVKAGKASNSKSAQQWRITAGEPSLGERLRMLDMRPGQLRAYNRRKSEYLVARKKQLAEELGRRLGRRLQPVTVGIILSPDNRRADAFLVPGFHARLGWASYAKEPYYAGTYDL